VKLPSAVVHLAADSVRYAISKAIPGAAGLASVLILVRLMGEGQYGRYAIVFVMVSAMRSFFTGWLGQSVLRYHSMYGERRTFKLAMRAGLVLSITLGTVVMLVLWGVGFRAEAEMYSAGTTAVIVLFYVFSSLYEFRLVLLQARIAPQAVVVISAVQAVTGVLLPAALLLLVAPSYSYALLGVALANLLAVAVPTRSTAPQVRRLQPEDSEHWQTITGRMWRYGWALSFWYAAVMTLQLSDRYFIQHYIDFRSMGSYSALHDVIMRAYSLLLFPITLAAHPRIMRLWNAGQGRQALSLWKWATAAMMIPFVVVIVVVYPFQMQIVELVLPDPDPALAAVVLPLVVGGFIWQFALLAHKPLEVGGRTRWMLAFAVVALGVNVVANYVFIPRFGLLVPAYTTVVAGVIYVILSFSAAALLRGHLLKPSRQGSDRVAS